MHKKENKFLFKRVAISASVVLLCCALSDIAVANSTYIDPSEQSGFGHDHIKREAISDTPADVPKIHLGRVFEVIGNVPKRLVSELSPSDNSDTKLPVKPIAVSNKTKVIIRTVSTQSAANALEVAAKTPLATARYIGKENYAIAMAESGQAARNVLPKVATEKPTSVFAASDTKLYADNRSYATTPKVVASAPVTTVVASAEPSEPVDKPRQNFSMMDSVAAPADAALPIENKKKETVIRSELVSAVFPPPSSASDTNSFQLAQADTNAALPAAPAPTLLPLPVPPSPSLPALPLPLDKKDTTPVPSPVVPPAITTPTNTPPATLPAIAPATATPPTTPAVVVPEPLVPVAATPPVPAANTPLAPSAAPVLPLPGAAPADSLSAQSKDILNKLPREKLPKATNPSHVELEHEHKNAMDVDDDVKKHKGIGVEITVQRPKADVTKMLEEAYDDLLSGDQESAIRLYKNVLEVQPKNKLALFGLATTYHRAGQIQLARPLYGKLLTIDPNNVEGLNNFLVLLADESPDSALIELNKLARTHPDFSPIPAQMAIIYEKTGQYESAIKKMEAAINLSPENLKYRYDMAIMLDKHGDWADAAAVYQQLLTANDRGEKIPGNPDSIQERLTYIRSNRPGG